MSKWLLILLAGVVLPFIIVYMWVRHPVLCCKEMYRSWMLCFKGKDLN